MINLNIVEKDLDKRGEKEFKLQVSPENYFYNSSWDILFHYGSIVIKACMLYIIQGPLYIFPWLSMVYQCRSNAWWVGWRRVVSWIVLNWYLIRCQYKFINKTALSRSFSFYKPSFEWAHFCKQDVPLAFFLSCRHGRCPPTSEKKCVNFDCSL